MNILKKLFNKIKVSNKSYILFYGINPKSNKIKILTDEFDNIIIENNPKKLVSKLPKKCNNAFYWIQEIKYFSYKDCGIKNIYELDLE